MTNNGQQPRRDCTNCIYFVATDEELDTVGECRRYAPRPRVAELSNARQQESWWPIVMQGEWCGEFQMSPHAYKKEPNVQENN